jgi:hypothetical protein
MAKRVQQPPSRRNELTQQLAFAALGAGVITTMFSAVAAVMVDQIL